MIGLLVALAAEAQPLIDRFELRRVPSKGRLFASEALTLMISGIGREAAVSGTVRLLEYLEPFELRGLINIGLAGHRSHRLGQVFLAARVEDFDTGDVWVPRTLADCELEIADVRTVSSAEHSYPDDVLYEMEAASFLSVATRLAPATCPQVLKVVSDNRQNSVGNLTAAGASRLMSAAVPVLESLVELLTADRGADDRC